MATIYLPNDLLLKDCKVVNENYVRVYDNSNYTSWTDVYFKSGYYLKRGYSTYGATNVVCDTLNTYSDSIFYRYDLADSLTIFLIISIFCFYIPYKIFSRAFGRWLRI